MLRLNEGLIDPSRIFLQMLIFTGFVQRKVESFGAGDIQIGYR